MAALVTRQPDGGGELWRHRLQTTTRGRPAPRCPAGVRIARDRTRAAQAAAASKPAKDCRQLIIPRGTEEPGSLHPAWRCSVQAASLGPTGWLVTWGPGQGQGQGALG